MSYSAYMGQMKFAITTIRLDALSIVSAPQNTHSGEDIR